MEITFKRITTMTTKLEKIFKKEVKNFSVGNEHIQIWFVDETIDFCSHIWIVHQLSVL